MKFEDFGVVSWYNGSFGVVHTPKNEEIFIHERNKVSVGLSEKNYVLIGKVKHNVAKDRQDGYDIVGFNEEQRSEFVEIILNDWIGKGEVKYDHTVAWLLSNGGSSSFKKILDFGYDYWIRTTNFNKWTRININKHSPYSHEYIFDRWSINKRVDNYFQALFKCDFQEVVVKVLNASDNLLYEELFEVVFKQTPDRNKIVIYDYVISRLDINNELKFIQDINWILKYASTKEMEIIVNSYKEHIMKSPSIIDTIVIYPKFLNSQVVNDLIFQHWNENAVCEYNKYIEYLINNSGKTYLEHVIKGNVDYWWYNVEFLNKLKSQYLYYDLAINLIFNRLSMEIINNKYFQSLNGLDDSESDAMINDVIWIIKHTDLTKFITLFGRYFNKDRFILNAFLPANYLHKTDIKEKYLFECWKHLKDLNFIELELWLEKYSSISGLINYISRKYNYQIELVDRWYNALFPDSNPHYYHNKVRANEWSPTFSKDYIESNIERIRLRFLELFVVPNGIKKRESPQKAIHSATDLANYQYCPASYVVASTFDISAIDNDSMFLGREEHKKMRLLSFKKRDEFIDQSRHYGDSNEYRDFVSLIARSQCTFEGHSEDSDETIIFYSEKGKISMVPDYLFKYSETEFIVEEKFTTTEFDKISDLYLNHKIQALAYLYGMPNPNISSVFIVYWFYNLKNREVYNSRIFRILKTEANKNQLLNIFESVEKLNRGEVVQLKTSDINVNKCVKCRAFSICKYKTGEYNSIKFE